MIQASSLFSLALIVLVTGFTGQQIVRADTPPDAVSARSFITPRIEGRRVDVHFTVENPANPTMTATRFCRLNGFKDVRGFSTQPVLATRTIGDYSARTGQLNAFYAIRCEGREKVAFTALI